MITEKDLQEAIAECEGERNPNANTCIKLAAFYTIKEHLFGNDLMQKSTQPTQEYSYANKIQFNENSEFAKLINNMPTDQLLAVMDELMSTLEIVQPRLYAGVMRKIKSLVS